MKRCASNQRLSAAGLSRRVALGRLGALAAVLPAVGPRGQAAAQEVAPDPATRGFVGAWVYGPSSQEPPPALATFGADGSLLVSAASPQPAPPNVPAKLVFTTAAHGAWVATSDRTAVTTTVRTLMDEVGAYLGTTTYHATLELDPDRRTMRGQAVGEAILADGTRSGPFHAAIEATRIEAEPTTEAGTSE